MKKLTGYLLVLALFLSFSQTDLMALDKNDKGKKGVPPGLQKKGGLPPGQAKKQNRTRDQGDDDDQGENESGEKAKSARQPAPAVEAPASPKTEAVKPAARTTPTAKSSPEPVAAANTAKPKPSAPPLTKVDPNKKVGKELEGRRNKLSENVNDLNQLGQNQASREKILDRLSKNTRQPVPALEAQLKAHPGLGAGDLYIAHMIAKKSKKPVDRILAQHEAGHSWGVLANEYEAGLGDLIDNTQETEAAAKKAAKR